MVDLRHTSISLNEILNAGGRLEATVYNLEAINAQKKLASLKQKLSLTDEVLIESATYPGRFKRKYVSKNVGKPFILPSQVSEINPAANKWITGLTEQLSKDLTAGLEDILLTRSGTVGKISIVGKTLEGNLLSDDLIRITPKKEYLGYLYTYLKSKVGQLLLTTSNYGAVIQHIEPHHLDELLVPIPKEETLKAINSKIRESLQSLDESNELIQEAQQSLIQAVGLPSFDELQPENYSSVEVSNFTVSFADLNGRIDASFHTPKAELVESKLDVSEHGYSKVSDAKFSKDIILPGRFKRVYVEEGYGVPFIGGKELGSLDPRNGKNLSLQGHGDRIKSQLTIRENQILITCSGTIGKVNLAPKHWDGWAASQHIIRIQPSSDWIAGYLYAWLSTDYGKELITRFTYGSVVDEIDNHHVSEVLVPLLPEAIMKKIGNKVLQANKKRYLAFELEKAALSLFETEVINIDS